MNWKNRERGETTQELPAGAPAVVCEVEPEDFQAANQNRFFSIKSTRHCRCTKGHEWEEQFGDFGTLSVLGESFCLRCLLEFCRQHAGAVEVVK